MRSLPTASTMIGRRVGVAGRADRPFRQLAALRGAHRGRVPFQRSGLARRLRRMPCCSRGCRLGGAEISLAGHLIREVHPRSGVSEMFPDSALLSKTTYAAPASVRAPGSAPGAPISDVPTGPRRRGSTAGNREARLVAEGHAREDDAQDPSGLTDERQARRDVGDRGVSDVRVVDRCRSDRSRSGRPCPCPHGAPALQPATGSSSGVRLTCSAPMTMSLIHRR